MGAPSGCSGAAHAEGGTVNRFLDAAHDLAADAFAGVSAGGSGLETELPRGVVGGEVWAEVEAAGWDRAEAAPVAVGDDEGVFDELAGGGVALGADGAGVGVFHFGAAGFELADAAEQALEDVDGFESGDDNRATILRGDRL